MGKQISLDAWQAKRLADLLRRGSKIVEQTNRPIVLYRQVLEEEDGCYEEAVCSLTVDYVVEQMVTSGGVLPPTFRDQRVYPLARYPEAALRKSKERFLEMLEMLEGELQ